MRHLLLLSLALILASCATAPRTWEAARVPTPGGADFPSGGPSPRHTQKVAEIQAGRHDLVLIGDSITHTVGEMPGTIYEPLKAVWDRHFAPRNAINLGHNGYRTENILWNLLNGELEFAPSPKVAVLLIGTNNADDRNFRQVHNSGQIANGIKAIVQLIRQRHPTTRILVLRPFPRGGDNEKGAAERVFNSSRQCVETIRDAGALTARLADGHHIFWLDVGHVFLQPNGTINTNLMPDLLHPNLAGAEAWARAIEPTLTRLMNAPPATTTRKAGP